MQQGKTFFNESFYHANSARTQGIEEDGCGPWSDEVQNYKKQPVYKPRQHLAQRQRRYTSQLDSYSPKASPKEERREKDTLLPFSSVTIQYGTEEQTGKEQKQSKIKLPILASKRRSVNARTLQVQRESWVLLGENKRSSLKRYTPRWRCEDSPPHFQFYKRSLIVARKFLLQSVCNPEASLQYLNSL